MNLPLPARCVRAAPFRLNDDFLNVVKWQAAGMPQLVAVDTYDVQITPRIHAATIPTVVHNKDERD